MIPKADIVAWRQVAPWVSDAQVEQDLIIMFERSTKVRGKTANKIRLFLDGFPSGTTFRGMMKEGTENKWIDVPLTVVKKTTVSQSGY